MGDSRGYLNHPLAVFGGELVATIVVDQRVVLSSWNGAQWRSWSGISPDVGAFTIYDTELVVAGNFRENWGGGLGNYISRWNGSSWEPLGSGLDAQAHALAVVGTSVYVGGRFLNAGGKPSYHIARWDETITPVLVEDLHATLTPQGIQLAWRLAPDAVARFTGVRPQRADAHAGPYADLVEAPLEPETTMQFLDTAPRAAKASWYRLELMDRTGERHVSPPFPVQVDGPGGLVLDSPADRGAGEPIAIRYALATAPADVRLEIFAPTGRLVRSWRDAGAASGQHVRYWDRRTGAGAAVSRGVYFVRLTADGVSAGKKLVVHSR